jgi:hypothetical protein
LAGDPADPAQERLVQLALEAADLKLQLADVEAALESSLSIREADARRFRRRLADAERALIHARQDAYAEAAARAVTGAALHAAESELEQLSRDLEPAVRELRAERRQRELELELEFVMRRSAEFEYGVRMALGELLEVLERLAARARRALGSGADPDPGAAAPDLARFDRALDRLRAEVPPREDPET